jgi:hypothetical protein
MRRIGGSEQNEQEPVVRGSIQCELVASEELLHAILDRTEPLDPATVPLRLREPKVCVDRVAKAFWSPEVVHQVTPIVKR